MGRNLFRMRIRSFFAPFGAGLAGAVTVTLLNEVGRNVFRRWPRLDLLGQRALSQGLRRIGVRPPRGRRLYWTALAGDLLSNSLYYGLASIGARRRPAFRGMTAGLLAGVGVVILPPLLGLGRRTRGFTRRTQAIAAGQYLLAGLASNTVARLLAPRSSYEFERAQA